jgi:hypothetical protein
VDFPPPLPPLLWDVAGGALAVDAGGCVLTEWLELVPPLCPEVPPQAAAAIATPSTTTSNLLRMIVTIPRVVVITEWNELRPGGRGRMCRSQKPPIWAPSWCYATA